MIHRTRVAFYRVALILVALAVLCACDGQAKQDAQATEVAQALHGTQTAMAPTATMPPTETPVPTATVTPPPTVTPTITPTPTPAPLTVGEIFDLISPAVAYVDTGAGSGSGVLIAGDYLLTNAHVVWPNETVRVVFADGVEFDNAPVACWDLLADLALVGPLDVDVEPLPLVDREDLPVASEVVLVGYPGEGDEYPQPTVSRGVLSRIREWEALGITYFQTDAAISGGQSGGVLVSDRAEVIGITGFTYTDAFGLAASAADIVPRLGDLLTCDEMGGLGARKLPSGVGVTSAYLELENLEVDAYVLNEPAGTEIDLEVESAGIGALVVLPLGGQKPLNLSTAPGQDTRGTYTTASDAPVFLLVIGDPVLGSTVHVTSSHPMHPVPDPDATEDSTGSHDDTVLAAGETAVGCLDYPLDTDIYKIELDKGEIVDIQVSSVLLDPVIGLDFVGSMEHEYFEDDDSGGGLFDLDARLVYQAPHKGVYQLRVFNLNLETGGYHISVGAPEQDVTPEPTRPAPTPTPTVIKSKYGDMFYFHFEDGPFGLRVPQDWEYDDELSDPYYDLLAFVGPRDRVLWLHTEHADGMDLEEYTDYYLDVLKDLGYKTSSKKRRTTDSGLEVSVLRMWSNDRGGIYRLLAVEGNNAVNVIFAGTSLTSLNNVSGLIYAVFDTVAVDAPEATPTPAPRAADEPVTLRALMLKNPSKLDPGTTMDGASATAIEQLFLGLTDFDDESGEVIPELAHTWKVSDDGLVWTFHLREDAVWVRYDEASGKAEVMGRVTAGDVVYAVKRALNPETQADAAEIDYIIKNAEALHKGESKQWSSLGVTAPDDLTVQFTLEHPASYFAAIAGMPLNRPVPFKPIGEHGDEWASPGKLWSNGPYLLADWQADESMLMVKNDAYYGADDVQIERVEWSIVSLDTAQAMYLNNELDTAHPLPEALDKHPRLEDEVAKADRLSTTYIGFNTTKAPFDDPRVRLAFAMATDKSVFEWDEPTFSQRVAETFGPPGLAGSPAESRDYEPVPYDPKAARKLLAEAGYPDGEGLGEITFGVTDSIVQTAMVLRSGWEANLGVKIILQVGKWEQHLAILEEDAPQMFHFGWGADYPDEHNYVYNVCHPTKGLNYTQWQPDAPGAAEFIKTVEQAASEGDAKERVALYARAETILCAEQAVLIPLYHPRESYLSKPYLHRTYAQFGGEHIHRWTISED